MAEPAQKLLIKQADGSRLELCSVPGMMSYLEVEDAGGISVRLDLATVEAKLISGFLAEADV